MYFFTLVGMIFIFFVVMSVIWIGLTIYLESDENGEIGAIVVTFLIVSAICAFSIYSFVSKPESFGYTKIVYEVDENDDK